MEQTSSPKSATSWTGADILAATGGRRVCGELSGRLSGVCIDSRTLGEGACFVAIVGKIHDGHRFCESVVEGGCRGLLVNEAALTHLPVERWRDRSVLCVAVADTTRALGEMAAYHRKRLPARLAAVTGSCGKTTTRDMIASVLGRHYRTLSSRKNFNNEIGVPLTLLALSQDHEWLVAELGMNRQGEIARLGEICRPDIGLITNIGPAHLEGLGTVERVMAAKAEILATIDPAGTAVLNADDPSLGYFTSRCACRQLLFGESAAADICGQGLVPSGTGTRFELLLPDGRIPVTLRVPGRFMVLNALAAAAVGVVAGLSPEEIRAGLEAFRPVSGRMDPLETAAGIHILDDTYNANPASMAAAIDTLAAVRGTGRGVVVLGDMLELGPRSAEFHRTVGATAARSGAWRVYATGRFADSTAAGALGMAMDPGDVLTGSREDLLADLKARLSKGDWVLVKGSRAAGMEKIVSELVAWAGGRKRKRQE